MLEGSDRTGSVGEGGLEMSEDVRGRPLRGFRRQLGRRALPGQCRANLALSQVESFPDTLQGPVTEMAGSGVDGGENATGGGTLEKPPQTASCQAEPSDFVGQPDAESPPATATRLAVAAKDPPRANGLSLRAAFVKSVQEAVLNQHADNLAVRARRLLEPFCKRDPFLGTAVKPSLFAHSASAKIVIVPAGGEAG
jgi:hypothetical protein